MMAVAAEQYSSSAKQKRDISKAGRVVSMGQLSVDLSVRLRELKKSLPIAQRSGVAFPRYFTARLEAGKAPYDDVQWELRNATIGNDKGAIIFEQRDVE